MSFAFTRLDPPSVVRIDMSAFGDARGWFMERYKQSAFADAGLHDVFVQDNLSRSARGVLRGLHYQLPPFEQSKLVSVIEGEIFDVAVDVRRGSATFGRWAGETLSHDNRRALYVPAGFAHGFMVLSDDAVVAYKTNHEYAPDYERGVRWDDPALAIRWPAGVEPVLSDKDRTLPALADADLPPMPEPNA